VATEAAAAILKVFITGCCKPDHPAYSHAARRMDTTAAVMLSLVLLTLTLTISFPCINPNFDPKPEANENCIP